ncbi:MAG: hypothetical protein WKF78_07985 [Candidatus Limnocylindrales bacterium]
MFLITSISIFFRPARVAILPRLVEEDELLTANSAMWVGETMADVIGYPLAGLFVVSLGTALPVAFWLDSATYIGSAALLSTIVLGARQASMETEASDAAASDEGAPPRPPSTTARAADCSARCRRAIDSCGVRPCFSRTPSRPRRPS